MRVITAASTVRPTIEGRVDAADSRDTPSTITTIQLTPSGALSRGLVSLTTVDQEVVGPIPTPGTYAALAIVYRHAATVKAGPIATTARVVTMSVVAGP